MQAGDLDTLITIQQPTRTKDPRLGATTTGWGNLADVWAQVQDMLPSRGERIAEGVNIQSRPARVRIRYRDDVTGDMRIKIGSRILEIKAGPATLGRREWLEMVCEEVSSKEVAS